jgi:hypothetical protein
MKRALSVATICVANIGWSGCKGGPEPRPVSFLDLVAVEPFCEADPDKRVYTVYVKNVDTSAGLTPEGSPGGRVL